ncbi:P-loop containing nucleoside triphosphate hydrolase protein [Limtongia smithiae]|uniref:P-loop containing nucleoside triphosphate hydrolase protein n=1 Tax=Limtongia smithiae TaxID=1125753 RepID=UPI0034CF39F0
MRIRKPTSKRTSTKMREGIKKKAAAHRKKEKKIAKKDITWKSRTKNNGRLNIAEIPNSFPYKNKIIEELVKENEAAKEERLKARAQARERAKVAVATSTISEGIEMAVDDDKALDDNDSTDEMETGDEMNALLSYARRAASKYDDNSEENGDEDDEDMDDDEEEDNDSEGEEWEGISSSGAISESSRKSFDKIFKSVIDASDVILYVLDARDPEGTRSKEVEQSIIKSLDKRLIFILNKIDLVPAHVQRTWESYLKHFFPTISVRASLAANNAQQLNHKSMTPQSTATTLLHALKSYANKSNLKRSIVVGVIGYPNVGKSSIINALASKVGGRTAACPVGAEAGVTTTMREVKIDNKLKLLDSPGIVFPSESENSEISNEARLLLLGALPPKQIEDAVPAVSALLHRLEMVPELWESLKNYYDVPALLPRVDANTGKLDKSMDFLVHVARKRGRIGRGGIPNIQAAAMTVVNDWRDGRIQRWVMPPAEVPVKESSGVEVLKSKGGKAVEHKDIVQTWAKEFSLDGLWAPSEEEPMEE